MHLYAQPCKFGLKIEKNKIQRAFFAKPGLTVCLLIAQCLYHNSLFPAPSTALSKWIHSGAVKVTTQIIDAVTRFAASPLSYVDPVLTQTMFLHKIGMMVAHCCGNIIMLKHHVQ